MVDHVAEFGNRQWASLAEECSSLRLSLHYRTDELRRSIEHLSQSPKRLWQRKCISQSNRSCDWRKKTRHAQRLRRGNVTGAATVAYWAITDAFGADVTPSRRLNGRESARGWNLAVI